MTQGVKDAIADAETLRLNDSRYDWLGAAGAAIARGQDVTAGAIAEEDARAAFCAVPGLRA